MKRPVYESYIFGIDDFFTLTVRNCLHIVWPNLKKMPNPEGTEVSVGTYRYQAVRTDTKKGTEQIQSTDYNCKIHGDLRLFY